MHISAISSVVLLGTGWLFSAQPPVPPRSPDPTASQAAVPPLDYSSLPPPRTVPRSTPSSPILEEPAPAPHEQPSAAIPVAPPGQFREEPAPMPREQAPMPARFFVPGGPRDPSLPDIDSLHRELEKLKMEREAMLAEEMDLVTAKDLRSSKSEQANLRKRLTELLAKTVQQVRREREAAEVVRSQGGNGNEKGLQTPAPSRPTTTAGASGSPLPKLPDRVLAQSQHPSAPSTPSQHPESPAKVVTDAPVDPLALAQWLFRTGDYTAALNTYRKLDPEQQKPEDRIANQYMMACCLRKLGKMDEATVLYREVANTAGDDFLMENAQWYLRTLKERCDLEGLLTELRQRRQAVIPRKQ